MDVTKVREQKQGHRMFNRRKDRRSFSRNADREHVANSGSGRPMRGGIRL